MTEEEVRTLLAMATNYDGVKRHDGNVKAWMEATNRNEWTFKAALDGLHQHYAESPDPVMPAHVQKQILLRLVPASWTGDRADREFLEGVWNTQAPSVDDTKE